MKRKSKRREKPLTLRDASLAIVTLRRFAGIDGHAAITTRGVAIATHLGSLSAILCCAHLCGKKPKREKRRGR